MRLYTKAECEAWLSSRERDLPSPQNMPETLTFWYPANPADIDWLWIANDISYRDSVLLWITEWGIWPLSENLHLYYRLRQSYYDHRLLHEAPGHFFQNFEMEDLATFLQVAATNGWGGYILPAAHYQSAFFSHDEYVNLFSNSSLEDARVRFATLLNPPSQFNSAGSRSRISREGQELRPDDLDPSK